MLFWFILSFLIVLLGFGAVAFLTLLERKLLSLSQIRLGPNKSSYFGVLQPVMDGIKLLFKEMFLISTSQLILFSMSPTLLIIMFGLMWVWVLPWTGDFFLMKTSSLLFFSLLGLGAYSVILTGWSSTSAFSKLGSLRGILQSLSFEVVLIFLFLVVLLQSKSLMMKSDFNFGWEMNIMWVTLWFMISLMETNRAPFDLLEGESELISGFNIEMGSLPFVFLFLSEYGMIIFMSLTVSVFFFNFISLWMSLFFSLLLFMRSCFPRVRYDIMMSMMWKSVLPVSVSIFILMMIVFYCLVNFM